MTGARVASLHLYPVKGCRGLDLPQADVDVTGLVSAGVGDREWMVVGEDDRFVTQRELPRLALVSVEIRNGRLRLAAPHLRGCDVPLDATGAAREIVVWRSTVRGVDAGEAAASWLSDWLAQHVRLVRFDRAVPRRCDPDYVADSGAHTMFADGYPVLVANTASLAELNDRLAQRGHRPLPMNRFRPNVVVDGLDAFAEDHIDTLAAGGVVLQLVKPCTRCQVTTTDQDSARVGIEPLRTLGGFRMDERFGGVTFGVNAIVAENAGGALAVGAPVTVGYRF